MHRALHFIMQAQQTPLEEAPLFWRITKAVFTVTRIHDLEDGAWLSAALRGAWGHQLKALSSEAFDVFFTTLAQTHEGRALPKPFNLSVESKGENLEITLSLFGIADAWRDVAFESLIKAFTAGISIKPEGFALRASFPLISWQWQRTEIVEVPLAYGNTRLLFKTPVRLGNKYTLRNAQLALVPALLSRVLALAPWFGLNIEIDEALWQTLHERLIVNSDVLTPVAWGRYSGAQNRRAIPMLGMMGHIDIIRTPDTLMPLLALAQTAFIGQHTALGLGRFELL